MNETVVVKKRLIVFDHMKAICAVLVVLHHSLHYYQGLGDSPNFVNTINATFHPIHVPIYLIIAGYFCHEQPIKKYYLKKLERIYIPFVFFSILKLIYSTLISNEFMHGETTLFSSIKSTFLIGTQYWFVYAILLMYLISPLFWKKSTGKQSYGIIALIVSYLTVCFLFFWNIELPDHFQISNTVSNLPYFALGCALCQNRDKIMDCYQKYRMIFLALSGIGVFTYVGFLAIYRKMPKVPIRFWVTICFFILLYVSLSLLKNKEVFVLDRLSKYSLQIMFLEGFYRIILFKLLDQIIHLNTAAAVLIVFPTLLLCVITCLAAEKIPYVRKLFGL